VLVVAVTVVLIIRVRYPGKATIRLPASDCNADLWNHVGDREKLHVIAACTSVEGRVVSLYRAYDGDLHIELDPYNKSVLNFTNAINSNGHLVVEIICEHTPDNAQDAKACAGFTSEVMVPQINDHVRVTGSYVTDRDTGWNEIHPVTRIRKLI
jgi:hypothetical protein